MILLFVNSSKITKLEEAFVSIIGAISSVWSAFSFPIYSWMNTARRQANHEVSEIMVHVDVGAEIGSPSEDGQEQEQEHKVRQHPSSSPPSTFYIDKMRMAKVYCDGNNDNDINN